MEYELAGHIEPAIPATVIGYVRCCKVVNMVKQYQKRVTIQKGCPLRQQAGYVNRGGG
jgi:hypothetical protein